MEVIWDAVLCSQLFLLLIQCDAFLYVMRNASHKETITDELSCLWEAEMGSVGNF